MAPGTLSLLNECVCLPTFLEVYISFPVSIHKLALTVTCWLYYVIKSIISAHTLISHQPTEEGLTGVSASGLSLLPLLWPS